MSDHDSPWRVYKGPSSLRQPLVSSSDQQSSAIHFVGVLFLVLGLIAVLPGILIRPHRQGPLTECKSNLKNIGTALEMYSTDWEGHYPNKLQALTPLYLKTIPHCPLAREQNYHLETGPKAGHNTEGFEDYYFIQCQGENHKRLRLAPNFPQYDCIQGLIEGPRL